MSYNSPFQTDFIKRSLGLVDEYQGPYDATLLVNCLLGLVVVPNALCYEHLPTAPIGEIETWSVPLAAVKQPRNLGSKSFDLRHFVTSLRNAITHGHFHPFPASGTVTGFRFWDTNGFEVELSLVQLRRFTSRLAQTLVEL